MRKLTLTLTVVSLWALATVRADNMEDGLQVDATFTQGDFTRAVFDAMWAAYPRDMPNNDILAMVGGTANNKDYKNSCCIRLTWSWNEATKAVNTWAEFPKASGVLTVKDKFGRNIALRVAELYLWLVKVWGPPDVVGAQKILGNKSRRGIVIFQECKWGAKTTATGHIDLLQGDACGSKCYFDSCTKISFWGIQDSPGGLPQPKELPTNVKPKGSSSGKCTYKAKQFDCKDQEDCVTDSNAKFWPAFLPGQCQSDNPEVKCCVNAF